MPGDILIKPPPGSYPHRVLDMEKDMKYMTKDGNIYIYIYIYT